MDWSVYMIRCTDQTLYTGISNDVLRRYQQHINLQGAKYFRAHPADALVYVEAGHDRSSASKREMEVKKLKRSEKLQLILSTQNEIDRFPECFSINNNV